MTNTPAHYHINTLRNRDRYSNGFNPDELQSTEASLDEIMYEIDGTPAYVIDDVEDRDGQYENSAAFMSSFLDQNLLEAEKIHDSEETYGFIATKPREEGGYSVETNQAVLQRTPLEVALVFEVAGKDQYDIKIE